MEKNKDGQGKEGRTVKKSGNATVKVVIAFVLLFVLGLGIGVGLFVVFGNGDSTLKDTEGKLEKVEETEKKEEIVKLSEEDIASYQKKIQYVNEFFTTSSSLDVRDINNQDLLNAIWMIAKSEQLGEVGDTIPKEDMAKYVAYIFGVDYTYQDENIVCFAGDGNIYNFNGSNYQSGGAHGHDGKSIYHSKSYFVSARRNDTKEILEIRMKVLYGDKCSVCGPMVGYYKTAGGELLYAPSDPEQTTFDEVYQQYQNQLPITTYTFKKDSAGNYGLQSIEIN